MRVMTYNIRGGLGMDGRRSTERIAEVVAAQSPDIVCFQEVHQRLPQSGFADQPRELEQRLGMPLVFQANLHLAFGGYGIAIASRFPVLSIQNHRLPSVREQRGALQVSLETGEGPLTVFCTHWGLNGEERKRQAETLASIVRAAQTPTLICGDLNEDPDGAAVQALCREAALADADRERNRLTYPADRPEARIDYVLYTETLTITEVFPVVSLASDHLPVVADLQLSG